MDNNNQTTPTQPTKLQEVIDVLKSKGYTEDQIVEFANDLTKTNFAKVYAEAMESFTEQDMQAVEAAANQEQANAIIRDLYSKRTGKNVEEVMQGFLDAFCDGFMEEYRNEQAQGGSSAS